VPAGEILIQEGETGLAASELYIVKEGTFEVNSGSNICCDACPAGAIAGARCKALLESRTIDSAPLQAYSRCLWGTCCQMHMLKFAGQQLCRPVMQH